MALEPSADLYDVEGVDVAVLKVPVGLLAQEASKDDMGCLSCSLFQGDGAHHALTLAQLWDRIEYKK